MILLLMRHGIAEEIEPGDRIIFYVTGVMAFAGSIFVESAMYEDRTPVWPGKPGKADPYPWRFKTKPDLVLNKSAWLPAEEVKDKLDHIKKWPAEHWKLAFQGQIRPISETDAELLMATMKQGVGS